MEKKQVQEVTQEKVTQEKPTEAHKQIDYTQFKTLEEGKQKGLSKQQLKKLQKKLEAEQKKKKKEQEALNQIHKPKTQTKKTKQIEVDKEYLQIFESQKIKINPNTKSPIVGQNNILITSALPYVNNVPHLGNIIGCVLSADVYARFKRLHGDNVLYICGTDEYGTATQVKAMEQKKTPRQICDYYNQIHSKIYQWFDIEFDYFGRTSTEWHTKISQQIFLDIRKQGKINQEQSEQLYCQKCDLPLADRLVVGTCIQCSSQDARGDQCDKCGKLYNSPSQLKDYKCSVCKNKPISRLTTHFYINLPQIQPELQKWIAESCVKGQWSQNSIGLTKGWLNMGLKPKCITRNLKWGVNVPIEEYKKKVFYVWFDAPIGYISITANLLNQKYLDWWQNKNVNLYQFMGKDNVPFHTVIFPCSLIATKKPWTLLHHISTTQYLNYEGTKFSKSRGTGVFGDNALSTGIPCEVWRYYLLVNRPQKSDSQFYWNDFKQKNNNELLANLGNLVHRALTFSYKQYQKAIPKIKPQQLSELDIKFIQTIKQKYIKYKELLNAVEIKQGLRLSMEISSLGNKYLQDAKFWENQNKDSGRSIVVIGVICNFIRLLSLILQPYLPSTSAKINFLLGIQPNEQDSIFGKIISQGQFTTNFCQFTNRSKGLRLPILLFREFTNQEIQQFRQQFKGKH